MYLNIVVIVTSLVASVLLSLLIRASLFVHSYVLIFLTHYTNLHYYYYYLLVLFLAGNLGRFTSV